MAFVQLPNNKIINTDLVISLAYFGTQVIFTLSDGSTVNLPYPDATTAQAAYSNYSIMLGAAGPLITQIYPMSNPQLTSGTVVIVLGANFAPVGVGGVIGLVVDPLGINVGFAAEYAPDSHTIYAQCPSVAAGTYDVGYTSTNGTFTLHNAITFV